MCCHHLLASESVKQEEPHMQRPWGNEEAIRKVLLVARVEGARRRKKRDRGSEQRPGFLCPGHAFGVLLPCRQWVSMETYEGLHLGRLCGNEWEGVKTDLAWDGWARCSLQDTGKPLRGCSEHILPREVERCAKLLNSHSGCSCQGENWACSVSRAGRDTSNREYKPSRERSMP